MKTTVIHHSADYDGLFCREIARKFLPDAALIGWDYGQPRIPIPEGQFYILDLSPDCIEDGFFGDRCIWIDHHKSAIDKFGNSLPGYRIDGVAACRLAWQWFAGKTTPDGGVTWELPAKHSYIERTVSEPLAVRLAGEYDIWDHRGDGDVEFQFGLDSETGLRWDWLLTEHPQYAQQIVAQGKCAMQCYAKRDADVMLTRSFLTEFEGLIFLCLNTPRCNSNTFAKRDVPENEHDALLAFYWTGKDFSVSLYHAAHRKELDLSQIAVKFGGGGHRGACGFRARTLPFVKCL